MGNFISNAWDDITGKTAADTINSSTQSSIGLQQQGLDELIRQFGISQENLAPFLQAGTNALPGVVGGSSVDGLDERIKAIFGSDLFSTLQDESQRSLSGGLASAGLSRSGYGAEAFRDLPIDLGLQLENLIFGRQQDLANMGQNTAVGAGTLGANNSNSINSSFGNMANTQQMGAIGAAQAGAAGTQNLLNLGGMGLGALTGSGALMAMSDPRLKQNIREYGKIGPLDLIEWDWTDEAKETIAGKCPTMGFMSTQVKEFYPEYVEEFGGFDVVNYGGLIMELQNGD